MSGVAALGRNLGAGLRLALGRKIDAAAFVVSVGAWLALFVFGLVLEMLLDLAVVGLPAALDRYAVVSEGFRSAVFILGIVVALVAMRRSYAVLPVLVMAAAAMPLLSLVGFTYEHWLGPRLIEAAPTSFLAWWGGTLVLAGWVWFVLARAGAIALAGDVRRWIAGLLIGAVVVFAVFATLDVAAQRHWFVSAAPPAPVAQYPSPASERALNVQPSLLAEALGKVGEQRAGVVDVFFVGLGAYASQDVFRRDLALAHAATALHLDSAERSVTLLNNRATALEQPYATVTNLAIALKTVGARMDREEDVLVLFVSSHGGREPTIVVENDPLELDPITPQRLRSMLDESGIRWRIIVISACYSGGFVPVLAEDHTLVMTAAAKDRASFGCSDDSELTFFTEALFRDAWRRGTGLMEAFDQARIIIEKREREGGHVPPSDPQIAIGAEMRGKLAALEARTTKP